MCLLTFDIESCGKFKTVCKQILDNAHTDRLYSYVYIDDDEELLLQNMRYTERNAIFRRLLANTRLPTCCTGYDWNTFTFIFI